MITDDDSPAALKLSLTVADKEATQTITICIGDSSASHGSQAGQCCSAHPQAGISPLRVVLWSVIPLLPLFPQSLVHVVEQAAVAYSAFLEASCQLATHPLSFTVH